MRFEDFKIGDECKIIKRKYKDPAGREYDIPKDFWNKDVICVGYHSEFYINVKIKDMYATYYVSPDCLENKNSIEFLCEDLPTLNQEV